MKFFLIATGFTLISISQEPPQLSLKKVWKKAAIANTLATEDNVGQLRDKNGRSILHYAATKDKDGDLIKYIIDSHATLLNLADNNGETPLHLAAFHGNYRAVELLLDAGANANAINKNGKTAAHKAVQINAIKENDQEIKINDKEAAFKAAQEAESIKHLGVIVTSLINHKANLNLTDHTGNTPLHDAAMRGNPAVYNAINNVATIKRETKNRDKYTATQLAKIAQSPILSERYLKNHYSKAINATSV